MRHYRVACRVLDLLVMEVKAADEEDAKRRALLSLAMLCAKEEESTVEIVAVAEMVES